MTDDHNDEYKYISSVFVKQYNCEYTFIYWYEIAHAVMCGHALSRKRVKELIKRQKLNMNDAYMICSVTRDLMNLHSVNMIAQAAVPTSDNNIARIVEPYLANKISEYRKRKGMSRK